MAYRTPLARVRGLGSAKAGAEHFWRSASPRSPTSSLSRS